MVEGKSGDYLSYQNSFKAATSQNFKSKPQLEKNFKKNHLVIQDSSNNFIFESLDDFSILDNFSNSIGFSTADFSLFCKALDPSKNLVSKSVFANAELHPVKTYILIESFRI
ncbi:hypothetical protein [Frigoriflavimonas asaccharolytica]|nr:hypothetical protein [Frigoriflavimonas asaccharolytica]